MINAFVRHAIPTANETDKLKERFSNKTNILLIGVGWQIIICLPAVFE
jgi:hypothetical protein